MAAARGADEQAKDYFGESGARANRTRDQAHWALMREDYAGAMHSVAETAGLGLDVMSSLLVSDALSTGSRVEYFQGSAKGALVANVAAFLVTPYFPEYPSPDFREVKSRDLKVLGLELGHLWEQCYPDRPIELRGFLDRTDGALAVAAKFPTFNESRAEDVAAFVRHLHRAA
jgi:hypothetical protein